MRYMRYACVVETARFFTSRVTLERVGTAELRLVPKWVVSSGGAQGNLLGGEREIE